MQVFYDFGRNPDFNGRSEALALFLLGGRVLWFFTAALTLFLAARRTASHRFRIEIEEPAAFWTLVITLAASALFLFAPRVFEPSGSADLFAIIPMWLLMVAGGFLLWVAAAMAIDASLSPKAAKTVKEGIADPNARPLTASESAEVAEQLRLNSGSYHPGHRRTKFLSWGLAGMALVFGILGFRLAVEQLPIQHLFRLSAIVNAIFAGTFWRAIRQTREVRVSPERIAIEPAGIWFDADEIRYIEFTSPPGRDYILEASFTTSSHSVNHLDRTLKSNGVRHRLRVER